MWFWLDPDSTWQVIVLIVLLGFSAFFSASETALMSLSKIRIRNMVEEEIKGAELIRKLVENPSKLLGTILVGNNIVNIGASALATSIAIEYFGSTGVGIATGVMTLAVLIFGEITPKSLAARNSEKISLGVIRIVSAITTILNPFVVVLVYITNGLIKIFGGKIDIEQPFITEEELKTMVDVSHEEGVLEVEEKQMIYNVFEFGDSQVKDVMVPRTDMVAIDIEADYNAVINIFKEEQFSRIPVYKDTIDNIVGVLYVKDLVMYDDLKKSFDISKYMREPFYTFEFKKITELFQEMREKRMPMAIVFDEYGGTAGIVTMEDLVEEIVGDIGDEYDDKEDEIEVIREDEYIVKGSTRIDLVNEMIGTSIESEDFDSIGGFVIGQLGRLPEQGETVEYNNIKFITESIGKNRIRKLKILT